MTETSASFCFVSPPLVFANAAVTMPPRVLFIARVQSRSIFQYFVLMHFPVVPDQIGTSGVANIAGVTEGSMVVGVNNVSWNAKAPRKSGNKLKQELFNCASPTIDLMVLSRR